MKESEIRNPSVHLKYLELVREDAELFFNDSALLEKINCPSCDACIFDFAFEKSGFDYQLCSVCRTLFVNPRPKLSQLEDFYVNAPSNRFWVEQFFKPVAEARREKIFRPRAEFVSKLIAGNDRLIVGDIGAGFGLFLDELSKINPLIHPIAIEPSPEMAEICRSKKIQVLESIVEKVRGHDAKFDLLCSFELFEHLHNPRSMIESAFNLLKPGGYLYITTLNGMGFDIQLLWEKSRAVFPPHHLNFFNPESLSFLLEKVGFCEIKANTPGKLDWDIVEGDINRKQFCSDRFWSYIAEFTTDECKQDLQKWLTKHNLSSHMRLVARKPLQS